MTAHRRGDGPDRPTYPQLVEDIGEDPARFLYGRERWASLARIRGIHRFDVIEAYRAVERNLAARSDREPRTWVLDALDDREAYLEEHGEFDPEIEPREIDTGPYPPEYWKSDEPGGLSPITPHPENIAEPATDGGSSLDASGGDGQ